MDTQEIVKELKAERARLDRAIVALDVENTSREAVARQEPSGDGVRSPRKHHLSAAGRKRLSILMKRRWAEKRKKKSSTGEK